MCNENSVLHSAFEESTNVVLSTPQTTRTARFFQKPVINAASKIIKEFTVVDQDEFNDSNIVLSNCYKNPYVYYDVIDILNFTKLCRPHNSNIKTVGIYTNNVKSHFLSDYRYKLCKTKNLHIVLDFTLVKMLPNFGEAIEVYGFVYVFKKMFVVQFWTHINSDDIQRQLSALLNQTCYTPLQYKLQQMSL